MSSEEPRPRTLADLESSARGPVEKSHAEHPPADEVKDYPVQDGPAPGPWTLSVGLTQPG